MHFFLKHQLILVLDFLYNIWDFMHFLSLIHIFINKSFLSLITCLVNDVCFRYKGFTVKINDE